MSMYSMTVTYPLNLFVETGDVTGDVTVVGDLTGDVTGDMTGDVTGDEEALMDENLW